MELAELLQGAGLADGVVACAAEALSEHGFPPLAQLVDLPHSDLERLLALGVGRVCVPAFAQHVILEHAAVQRLGLRADQHGRGLEGGPGLFHAGHRRLERAREGGHLFSALDRGTSGWWCP